LITKQSFNGFYWYPYNEDSNDDLTFEVAQKNNISINLSKLLLNRNIKKVSNAPGIIINPGQLSYGLQMLAAGKEIDYQGATDVEFNAFGDANGAFKEVEVRGGSFVTVGAL